jgi:hypothetical protein
MTGDATGLGDGVIGVTRSLSSCTTRASQSRNGPLLAADSLRGAPRFEATRSAKISALRRRRFGDTTATSARVVMSSMSLIRR